MKDLLRRYGAALVTGVLLATSFPVFHLYPLAWLALVPLLVRTRNCTPRSAAVHFFAAGYVFHTILLQWFITDIMWAGGWAIIGQQFLCLVLALYWALTGGLWIWLRARTPAIVSVLGLAVLWVAMEQLMATLFTGFGWSSLAYSQGKDLPLIQWAALGGAPFVSLFLVLTNALLAEAFASKKGRFLSLSAIVLVAGFAHGIGYLLLDEPEYGDEPFRVGIFQSNFGQQMKWDGEYTSEMVRSAARQSVALAKVEAIDLMVWPEALVVGDIGDRAIARPIVSAMQEGDFQLFTGAARRDATHGYNSSYLMDRDGRILDTYDKMHLAPFGEYIPFSKMLPFIKRIIPSIGDMTPGTELRVMSIGERKFGPLICYEMLYPHMAQQLKAEGADFLVVLLNLGWFGRSNAIPQELEITRIRAIETRLPIVHCANTGISGVFDPWGRFSMVNKVVDTSGKVWGLREGLGPRDIVMRRLVGAFDLPKAATPLHPFQPRYVSWFMVALSAAMLGAAGLFGKPSSPEGTS